MENPITESMLEQLTDEYIVERDTEREEDDCPTVAELLEQLQQDFTEATSSLDCERAALEKESSEIQAARAELELLLPAKARQAERDADALLLAGKHEEAQAKRDEQQQAERAPDEMEQRLVAIAARIGEIEAAKQTIAVKVFDDWLPDLREELLAQQQEMVDDLNSAWAGIVQFSAETQAYRGSKLVPLATENLRRDLTARERGEEAPIFAGLQEWFSWGQK